jgi:hypothetical protein
MHQVQAPAPFEYERATSVKHEDEDEDEVRIGVMTRHRALLESELLRKRLPIVTDAGKVLADPIVRNRATIGGALCQADPSEDLSAVCAAVDLRMVIRGPDGERRGDLGGDLGPDLPVHGLRDDRARDSLSGRARDTRGIRLMANSHSRREI